MALQTKTFSLGDFAWGSDSNAYVLELVLTEESADPVANASVITYRLQLRSGVQNRFAEDVTSRLSFDGAQVATAREYRYLDYNSVWVLLSGEKTVPHSEDGSKALTFEAVICPDAGNQWAPPEMRLTGEFTLTAIPRAGTIAATAAPIGQCATVVVTRFREDYRHSIAYRFGNLRGYLNGQGQPCEEEVKLEQTLLLFALPECFYYEMTHSQTALCTLVCTTYLGDTPVGTPQETTFSVTADGGVCAPVISGFVEDVNPDTLTLTGGEALVAHRSKVRCVMECEGRFGAEVVEKYVNDVKIEDEVELDGICTGEFTFRVVDSRGYAASCTVSLPLVSYVPVTAVAWAKRPGPTVSAAEVTVEGLWYDGDFPQGQNDLAVTFRVGDRAVAVTPELRAGGYSASALLQELDYRQAHTITVEVADRLMTASAEAKVNRGVPVFDWGEGDFAFHVPVYAPALDSPTLDEILSRLAALETAVS